MTPSWLAEDFPDEYYEDLVVFGRSTRTKRKESTMDVSEDGTVTGSIDVAALDDIDPKTPEAKAQIEALKAEAAAAQEQADADAEARAAEPKPESKAEAKPDDKAPAAKKAAAPSHSSTDKG